MKKATFLYMCAGLLLCLNVAHAKIPKPGEAAPELKLQSILQANGSKEQSIKSLKGKVVVLEFWATWCAPCIGVIPHLNELSEKYKSKNVQFISVTDESEEKIKPFLKKRPINGWVGIDSNKELHDAYNVQYIPFTVVIGADGRVLGYPTSRELSEQMLDKALAGQLLAEPIEAPVTNAAPAEVAEPLYELSIRPSAGKSRGSMTGPNIFMMKGADAFSLILNAYGATKARTQLQSKLPDEERYDVMATNPLGKEKEYWAWRVPVQELVQQLFNVDVQQEQKEVPVYELIAGPATAKRLKQSADNEPNKSSTAEGVLSGRKASMATIAGYLEGALGIPVVDATNLTGKYNYDLYFDPKNPETLLKVLETETGLKLKKTTRTLPILVVSPRQ